MVVPIALIVIIANKTGYLDQAADKMRFNTLSWFDNTALVEHLRILVTHDGMTDQPGRCLVFIVDGNSPPDATKIDVMGKHTKDCPANISDFPRLFTLKINRADRIIQTDAGTPGQFRTVPQS